MVFCNIPLIGTEVIDDNCHNPYFNRWFSAIQAINRFVMLVRCHNPYFNRWFSAIVHAGQCMYKEKNVTILILIDGFLQFSK